MGAGGSRFGAGRPGWRRKCEQLLRIDLRRLQNWQLWPGASYPLRWSWGDEPAGSVNVKVNDDRLHVSYRWTPYGYDPMDMKCSAPILKTPCRYGGTRRWFLCPRCDRRCVVLYGVASDGKFGCRECMRLGYASECESPTDRLLRKQQKLEARLIDGEFKPKGMHWQTYERLQDQINTVSGQADLIFVRRFASLAGSQELLDLLGR